MLCRHHRISYRIEQNALATTMTGMITYDAVAIGVGAFCGAYSRYQCGRVAAEWIATDPNRLGRFEAWHTAMINIGGSFILGAVSGVPLISPKQASAAKAPFSTFGLTPRTKLMMGVGFCGSFTTFSTYSVDVARWLAQGKTTKAVSYMMTNNVGGVVAATAGMLLVKKIFG